MITLIQSRDAVLQKLLLEYGAPLPIEAVNCVREDVIKKVLRNEMVDISFTNEG
jgi:hypothetical protein